MIPFVDASGNLQIVASDRTGHWRPTVNFVPARITLGSDGFYKTEMVSWRTSSRCKEERLLVPTLTVEMLPLAMGMLKTRLTGLEILTTDAGVVVVDRRAVNRQRVESAGIWLKIAAQYIDCVSQMLPGLPKAVH